MITIGLPVFNAEQYLDLTLKSIFAQSFKDWKLIIINDGSTDNSEKVLQPFLKDKRVQYSSDVHKGLGYRLNQLAQIVETPYYARMDADDIMFPERLKIQLDYLQAHPDTDLIGSSIVSINENNEIIGERIVSNDFSTQKILLRHPITHPTVMGKTEWFKRNLYKEQYYRAEDRELWLRTHQSSNFHNLQIPLLFYREGNVDVKNYIASKATARQIYKDYRFLFKSDFSYRLNTCREFLKAKVYYLFGIMGTQKILTRQRSSGLSFKERADYKKIITSIACFPLNDSDILV